MNFQINQSSTSLPFLLPFFFLFVFRLKKPSLNQMDCNQIRKMFNIDTSLLCLEETTNKIDLISNADLRLAN